MGVYWNGRYLQSCLSLLQSGMDIMWKELLAIVLAAHTWVPYGLLTKLSFIVTVKLLYVSGTGISPLHLIQWLWSTSCIFALVAIKLMYL